jgi:hypothetical protein
LVDGPACSRVRIVKIGREPALATRRAIIAAVSGCIVAGVAQLSGASWSVAALCGFDLAAVVFVGWVALGVARADAATTAQIARTDLGARPIRRAALHHALLSYLFGTVIVAITVSTVAGLVT